MTCVKQRPPSLYLVNELLFPSLAFLPGVTIFSQRPPLPLIFAFFFPNAHLIVYSRDSQDVFGGKKPSIFSFTKHGHAACPFLAQHPVPSGPTWAGLGQRGKEVRRGHETVNVIHYIE